MKRAIVFTDISGLGNCSGSANIALLSMLGVEPVFVPTALLSAQTGFAGSAVFPFTEHLDEYITSLETISPQIDAIYIGFMAGGAQAAYAERLAKAFPCAVLVVDPILGDNGREYPFCGEMKGAYNELLKRASVITPNLTELCILSGASYEELMSLPESELTDAAAALCRGLMSDTLKTVVVTGIDIGDMIANVTCTADRCDTAKAKRFGGSMSGTGDIMTSFVCAAAAKGEDISTAVSRAASFISSVMEQTDLTAYDRNYGIPFQEYGNGNAHFVC